MAKYEHVLSPLTIRGKTFKNRVEFSPFVANKSSIWGEVTQETVDFIEWQAQTGIGSMTAMPKEVSYAVSKGGVIQLTRTIAYEYAADGIRCNAISPGLTQTELVKAGSPIEKLLQDIVPSKTSGTPEGIANAAVFMASDETPFMSGANLVIDGACTCGPCPDL